VTVERSGAKQDLVLNLAELASEAERIATAPPPDPTQPGGASPPGPPPGVSPGDIPPPPPGPEAESAR
jgi:hypothetical protein